MSQMGRKFHGMVIDKTQATEMAIVGNIFEILHVVGVNVPTAAEFKANFATTLGPLVYLPSGWDSRTQIDVGTHEFTHVDQFWTGEFKGDVGFGAGFGFAYLYLMEPEARVRAEQHAMRAQWELKHLAFGEPLPKPKDCAMILEHGYMLDASALKLAEDLAEVWLTEVYYGKVDTDTGAEAIRIVKALGIAD